MKTKFLYLINSLFVASAITACSDNENQHVPSDNPENNEKPEWYYTGGQLGTAYLTTSNALEQPTEPIEANEEMSQRFKNGEQLFEKMYMNNHSGVRKGLGPAYVRSSCIHCHPGYGHGKRNPAGAFQTTSIGNGCLLVVYNPDTDGYVSWLTGMPQGHATQPFKAPLDESKVIIEWKKYTDEWGNKFPDGESYDLEYPEVTLATDAVYAKNEGVISSLGNYKVLLESTIGIYGTGLLDAISDDDLKAQYAKEEQDSPALHPPLPPHLREHGRCARHPRGAVLHHPEPRLLRRLQLLRHSAASGAAGHQPQRRQHRGGSRAHDSRAGFQGLHPRCRAAPPQTSAFPPAASRCCAGCAPAASTALPPPPAPT